MSRQQPKRQLSIVYQAITDLKPRANNARTHSKKQVQQIAAAIKRFGFTNPVLTDESNSVIAGHGRLEAAKLLGLREVPAVRLSDMSIGVRLGPPIGLQKGPL